MNARQSNDLAMLKRVYDFVTSTPPAPPLATPPAGLPQLTTQLKDTIAKADTAANVQGSAHAQVTASQRAALRRTLRTRYLIPIRHVARILGRTIPGLDGIVKLPKKVVSEGTLLTAAKATVVDVTPYQDDFITKGLAPDFIAQLNSAITAVERAADNNITAKRQKLTATADLKATLTDGRDIVVSIGHVVQAACDQDKVNGPATRSAWSHIQHVHNASAVPIPITTPSSDSTQPSTSQPTSQPSTSTSAVRSTPSTALGGTQ